MNKNKVITSVGVIFLVTGIVGGAWSGIQAMPKMINKLQDSQNKEDEAVTLYDIEEEITKLNVDSKVSNVYIKKHNKSNVVVQRRGNKELSNISAKTNNGELIISEEPIYENYKAKNIDDIVKQFIDNMYSSHNSEIVIYLPQKVNADIKTDDSSIIVEDDILLDTLNYETYSGQISLLGDENLENLNITSSSDVSLTTSEINGIKNVNIVAETVYIDGVGTLIDESKIPENLLIKITSTYYDSYNLDINTTIPVAKNLVIDSASTVGIGLPIVDYKFDFDVNASRGIKFEAENIEQYENTSVAKYFEQETTQEDTSLEKEFKGLINEELKDKENEYSVKINSAYTIFK